MEKVTFTSKGDEKISKKGNKYCAVNTSDNRSGTAMFVPVLNTPTEVDVKPSVDQAGNPDGKFLFYLPKASKPKTTFSGSVTRKVGALNGAINFIALLDASFKTKDNVLKVADVFDEWLKKEDPKTE